MSEIQFGSLFPNEHNEFGRKLVEESQLKQGDGNDIPKGYLTKDEISTIMNTVSYTDIWNAHCPNGWVDVPGGSYNPGGNGNGTGGNGTGGNGTGGNGQYVYGSNVGYSEYQQGILILPTIQNSNLKKDDYALNTGSGTVILRKTVSNKDGYWIAARQLEGTKFPAKSGNVEFLKPLN